MFQDVQERAQFLHILTFFKGQEVQIEVKKIQNFDYAFIESANLQDSFTNLINKDTPDFTNQEINILRGKMAACSYVVNEWLAKAKSDENDKDGQMKIYEAKKRIELIEQGEKTSIAVLKSRSHSEYEKFLNAYNDAYRFRVLVEAHAKGLTDTMNALSSISKAGDITQFNINRKP